MKPLASGRRRLLDGAAQPASPSQAGDDGEVTASTPPAVSQTGSLHINGPIEMSLGYEAPKKRRKRKRRGEVLAVAKHLQGQHDQMSHAGRGNRASGGVGNRALALDPGKLGGKGNRVLSPAEHQATQEIEAKVRANHGRLIGEVDLAGLRPREAQGVADALDRHFKDFPGAHLETVSTRNYPPQFAFMGDKWGAATQHRATKRGVVGVRPAVRVYINEKHMTGNFGESANGIPWTSAHGIKDPRAQYDIIMTHELGHVVALHGESGRGSNRKGSRSGNALRTINNTLAGQRAMQPAYLEAVADWRAEVRKSGKDQMSVPGKPTQYALTTPAEFFAENFTIARTKPAGFKAHPDTMKWAEAYKTNMDAYQAKPKAYRVVKSVDDDGWETLPPYPVGPDETSHRALDDLLHDRGPTFGRTSSRAKPIAKSSPDTVAILLMLPRPAAERVVALAPPGMGEAVDQVHVTLAVVPGASSATLDAILAAVQRHAERFEPPLVSLTHLSHFTAGDDCAVLEPDDSAAIDRYRAELVESLRARGVAASGRWAYRPHATVCYFPNGLEDGSSPLFGELPAPVTFVGSSIRVCRDHRVVSEVPLRMSKQMRRAVVVTKGFSADSLDEHGLRRLSGL